MGAVFVGSYVLDFFGISLPIRAGCWWDCGRHGQLGFLLNDQGQDKLRTSVAADQPVIGLGKKVRRLVEQSF